MACGGGPGPGAGLFGGNMHERGERSPFPAGGHVAPSCAGRRTRSRGGWTRRRSGRGAGACCCRWPAKELAKLLRYSFDVFVLLFAHLCKLVNLAMHLTRAVDPQIPSLLMSLAILSQMVLRIDCCTSAFNSARTSWTSDAAPLHRVVTYDAVRAVDRYSFMCAALSGRSRGSATPRRQPAMTRQEGGTTRPDAGGKPATHEQV